MRKGPSQELSGAEAILHRSTIRECIHMKVQSIRLMVMKRIAKAMPNAPHRLRRTMNFALYIVWKICPTVLPVPQVEKARVIREWAAKRDIKVLVETGTYLGDTIQSTRHSFEQIFSIELDRTLHNRARLRFAKARNVTLINGDSSLALPTVLSKLDRPTLFWLDAHFSEGITAKGSCVTPILKEVELIVKSRSGTDVILIDDAPLFDGTNGYPTIESVTLHVKRIWPAVKVCSESDIIILSNPEFDSS